jgi:uncharacterized membrane protein YphA (DoxX/SURF4 family)
MERREIRFLAFGLGALLIFHGIDKIINGTKFIENLIIGVYIPSTIKEIPCGDLCMSSMMAGTNFMGTMFSSTSHVSYSQEARYISYLVYMGEIVAPIFLLFGAYIRIASTIVIINMSVVIFLVYRNCIFNLSRYGGWSIELPILYILIALTLILSKKR